MKHNFPVPRGKTQSTMLCTTSMEMTNMPRSLTVLLISIVMWSCFTTSGSQSEEFAKLRLDRVTSLYYDEQNFPAAVVELIKSNDVKAILLEVPVLRDEWNSVSPPQATTTAKITKVLKLI